MLTAVPDVSARRFNRYGGARPVIPPPTMTMCFILIFPLPLNGKEVARLLATRRTSGEVGVRGDDYRPPSSLPSPTRGEGSRGKRSLFNHVRDHLDKERMISHGLGPVEIHSGFARGFFGFDIQIKEDLDMIGDKSDGDGQDVTHAFLGQLANVITDIGFQPSVARCPAAAGICEPPILDPKTDANQRGGRFQLLNIAWRFGHGNAY